MRNSASGQDGEKRTHLLFHQKQPKIHEAVIFKTLDHQGMKDTDL